MQPYALAGPEGAPHPRVRPGAGGAQPAGPRPADSGAPSGDRPHQCRPALPPRRPRAAMAAAVRPSLRAASAGPTRGPRAQSMLGRLPYRAAVRSVGACLAKTAGLCGHRRDDGIPHPLDADTNIASISPARASSVASWSSCGKACTTRYGLDARFAMFLFSRTTLACAISAML